MPDNIPGQKPIGSSSKKKNAPLLTFYQLTLKLINTIELHLHVMEAIHNDITDIKNALIAHHEKKE